MKAEALVRIRRAKFRLAIVAAARIQWINEFAPFRKKVDCLEPARNRPFGGGSGDGNPQWRRRSAAAPAEREPGSGNRLDWTADALAHRDRLARQLSARTRNRGHARRGRCGRQ